jgi:hypothetical protein
MDSSPITWTTNRTVAILLAGCLTLSVRAAAIAADEVAVQLSDGRTVSGEIDGRTDNTFLWLRRTAPAIILRSAFPWKQVIRAKRGNEELSVKQLRLLAQQAKSDAATNPATLPPRHHATAPPIVIPPAAYGRQPHWRAADRIRSLHVDAVVANWDDDVEDDGLLVRIYPLTVDGRLIPVTGILQVTLTGRALSGTRRRDNFPEIGRWSKRVRAVDFGPDGAVYQLPFRNFRPEQDLDIDVDGLLHARLSVPTQGVFHASDANVRLRRLSKFRDRLQLQRGRRLLPRENARRR